MGTQRTRQRLSKGMKYIDLSKQEQLDVLNTVSQEKRLAPAVIEKDWWVTAVLRALFQLPYAEHLSFKGGTSLSKCWGVIERFSEDIDIAVNRDFLGYGGKLSKTQISDRLRRAACTFVRETLQADLRKQLEQDGIDSNAFQVTVHITPISTTDPEIIEVEYRSVLPASEYIRSKVIVEVSGRSMSEPVEQHLLNSFVDEVFPSTPFAEEKFPIMAVVPERTFLEKVFLLHEEFSKPTADIRTQRMSRHMYDICKMMETPIAEKALSDEVLYRNVIAHRRTFIGLRGFDYDTLFPQTLCILPPAEISSAWREDYKKMQASMIYGASPDYEQLIVKLRSLNERIRQLPYTV